MSTLVVFIFRIGLLVLLWLGVLFALRVMARDTTRLAGPAGATASSQGAHHAQPRQLAKQQARQLVAINGAMAGSTLEVDDSADITIGRSPECEFVVHDDFASARHARLFRRGGDWFVEDLDSRNGTHLAGVRIDQPEQVDIGTDITIGRTTVRLMP